MALLVFHGSCSTIHYQIRCINARVYFAHGFFSSTRRHRIIAPALPSPSSFFSTAAACIISRTPQAHLLILCQKGRKCPISRAHVSQWFYNLSSSFLLYRNSISIFTTVRPPHQFQSIPFQFTFPTCLPPKKK